MEKPDLLIANISAMQTKGVGDYVYRVEQPSRALGRVPGVKVINATTISPFLNQLCKSADVLILHLLTEPDLLPAIEDRKRKGLCTIYEISDNFFAIQKGFFAVPANIAAAFHYIRLSDAIQVTGEGLVEKYGFLNSRVAVFENQIETQPPMPDRTRPITIGWGGSLGHGNDLASIVEVLQSICHDFPDVHFAFMGNPEQTQQVFSSIPDNRKTCRPGGTLDDYLSFLAGIDIGIAPLLDTAYNQCRSDVKFIEYASRGAVPVLSYVKPYLRHAKHGENALVFQNNEELSGLLRKLIAEPQWRLTLSRNVYRYVAEHRIQGNHSQERLEFYQNLCAKRAPRENLPELLSPLCPGLNAFDVARTKEEDLLAQGIALHGKGMAKDARIRFEEAARLAPGYYLPHFWLGYAALMEKQDTAPNHFEQAHNRNPWSLRSLLYKGDSLAALGRPAEAIQCYEKAFSIAPSYSPALERIADRLEEHNQFREAQDFYAKALEINPFSSIAASGLARVSNRLGDKAQAIRAYRVAADLAPFSAETQYQAANILFHNGDYAEASLLCMKALETDPNMLSVNQLAKQLQELNK